MSADDPRTRGLRRRALLASAASAGAVGLLGSSTAGALDGRGLVTVDFSAPKAVKSMSGFLNSIQYPDPPAAMIVPLEPRLWRNNDLRQYGNIRDWGARFEGPLADGWGYPVAGRWTPPYRDFGSWEAYVRRIAHQCRDKTIWWDVWNEPDSPGSWIGSREQFFETWIRAARVLREVLGPGTMVGGPSTTSFQPDFIRGLLESCLAAGTELNFLTWHELEPWSDIALVAENLRVARRSFVDESRFAPLRIREIHIHEFVGEVDQYRPAELLAFLWFLESGGADAAARSCWSESCTDNSIDGIIDPRTREPRAVWWVHRFYAEGTDRRLSWRSDEPHVVALGQSLPADGSNAQVLIGYYGHEGVGKERVRLRVRLDQVSGLIGGSSVQIRVCRIPDSGRAPVPMLPIVREWSTEPVDGAIEFDLDPLRVHEVLAVMLKRA